MKSEFIVFPQATCAGTSFAPWVFPSPVWQRRRRRWRSSSRTSSAPGLPGRALQQRGGGGDRTHAGSRTRRRLRGSWFWAQSSKDEGEADKRGRSFFTLYFLQPCRTQRPTQLCLFATLPVNRTLLRLWPEKPGWRSSHRSCSTSDWGLERSRKDPVRRTRIAPCGPTLRQTESERPGYCFTYRLMN